MLMKNILLKIKWLIVGLVFSGQVLANHIVGGELKMKASGTSNTYEISLIQFWDKKNLTIPTPTIAGNRDPDAVLYIYSKRNNSLMDRVTVTYRSSTPIEYQNKACATSRSLETIAGLYTGTVTLSPQTYNDAAGYYLVWERCCRNDDINNIVSPGDNGMVFYLEFPATTISNSSPEFQLPNGQYICNKRDFSMNMSAVDTDGDELRYSLVTPMRGNTNPSQPKGDVFLKNDYPLVAWSSGVSLSNVIPGSVPLSIDQNGILKVNADNIGLYVFAIQCEEYRNGKKIGLVRRDFQLLVIDCNDDAPEPPVVMFQAQPVHEILFCPEKPVQLETEASTDWSYQWQLNGLNISGATSSAIMVSDTGSYSVVKSFVKKCSRDASSEIVHLAYQSPPDAVISISKPVICKGDSAILLANDGSLAAGLMCSWTLDNISLSSTSPRIEVNKAGMYRLLITDQNLGCYAMDSIVVQLEDISIDLPSQLSMTENSLITLSPIVNPEGSSYTYRWAPPDGIETSSADRNITISPSQSIEYTVTLSSPNGCSDTATVKIIVIDKMHIPTAFSPNNDGLNDRFEIFNAKEQIQTIRVFNRWGEVIFSSDGYAEPWNGTYKNEPVPAGSYPYIIKSTDKEYKGEILVLH